MNLNSEQALNQNKVGIFFVGIGVYLNFFQRFYDGLEKNFMPDTQKVYFVFTDNNLKNAAPNVEIIKVPFSDPWFTKIHKFHFISSVLDKTKECSWLFYFDADSSVNSPVSNVTAMDWLVGGYELVGVLHPWVHIRNQAKRFEQNPVSSAYVPPEEFHLMDYHQSCFWGGTADAVVSMTLAIRTMVDRDLAINHTNQHNICDEIYVNRYFLSNLHQLRSLGTEYANPGNAYEQATAKSGKPGYRFPGEIKVMHDNAAQTYSWRQLKESTAYYTHGAYAQFFKNDLAAYNALESYRRYNAENPIVLVGDGGDDLSSLADKFSCHYFYDSNNIGTSRSHHPCTNQYNRLNRIRKFCGGHLSTVDWIVILEPDVECFRPPSAIPRYALSGPGRGPAWSDKLQKMFESRHPKRRRNFGLGYNYTGCGGSIFNRQCFVTCFDRTSINDFTQAAELDPRIRFAEDASMSFLFQFNGFNTGEWEEFTGWTKEHKSEFAFAHGDKQFYGKPSPLS